MTVVDGLHHREFRNLVVGKALSAGLGLGVLAILWRAISPAAYGDYLALLALMEILVLVSAVGLSTLTQRHLPVWVAHATGPMHALGCVTAVVGLRAVLAAVVAALAFGLSGPWMPDLLNRIGLTWWLGWVVSGALMRSLEEVQSALLMQAWVQALVMTAHVLRLWALWVWPPGPVLGEQGPAATAGASLQFDESRWLLGLEMAVASVTVLVGLAAVVARLIRHSPEKGPMALERIVPWHLAWRNSLGFWAIQCLGLTWSLHALRLIAQALAGPSVLAVHAAAQALSDAWRQASPLVWMSGWLRATMLRLHATQPEGHSAWHLVRGLERASTVFLWPVLAAWCVEPEAWLRWVAGVNLVAEAHRLSLSYPDLPPFTALLAAAALLVPLQNHHLALALWSQTQQRWRWGLFGAIAAMLWPATLTLLWPLLGLWSLPLVMVGAEWTWIMLVSQSLRESGSRALPGMAFMVPVTALAAAATARWTWVTVWAHIGPDQPTWWPAAQALWPALTAALAVMLLLRKRSAWSTSERHVVLACLPPMLAGVWHRLSSGARG